MRRALRNLLRLLASGLILFGLLEVGLELIRYRTQGPSLKVWHCAVGSILVLAGILLAALSARVARHFTDDDEDEDGDD